jgi:polyisoprenoid-binding protein YceI
MSDHKKAITLVKRILSAAVLLGIPIVSAAEVQSWQIDPNHTATQFSVRHMGISTVRGAFEKTTGTISYDPADPSKLSIDATIDTTTVNTRVQMRDNDLRSAKYLDVSKYPAMTFRSTRTEIVGADKLKITGDLTIHGVTKQVVLDVEGPSEAIKDPMGNSRMGASATTTINRNDFGITAMHGMIGDEIQIVLDVEMTRPAK